MKRRGLRVLLLLPALLLAGRWTSADVLTTAGGEKLTVTVLRVTDEGVVVKTADGEKTYKFDDLEAACAYAYLRRTTHDKDAEGHIRLGKYCLKRKLLEEAKAEFAEAAKLDPALEEEIKKIWAEANDEKPRPTLSADQIEVIEAEQRTRGMDAAQATGQKVVTLETDHFIIHTTFPAGDHQLFKDLCENLYLGFDRIFQISKTNDRMWDGKCVMYFFRDREGFVKFSSAVHHYPAGAAGGYFRAQGGQCEVVIPNLQSFDRFKETLVHEGAHAFLHFYRAPGHVPTWVHEGVAQYFQFDRFPESSTARMLNRTVLEAVKSYRVLPVKELAKSRRPGHGADFEAYAFSYSYVDYLIRKAPKGFAEFVRGMKSGLEPEEALKKAYDWDYESLQKNWLRAVSRSR